MNARYGVWKARPDTASGYHNTWDEAESELNEDDLRERGYRIWDHSTTPPTDVTDYNPENNDSTPTVPPRPIPACLTELKITATGRPEQVWVHAKAPGWVIGFLTNRDDAMSEVTNYAAYMEGNKL